MPARRGKWLWLAVVVAILALAEGAQGQAQLATRGPRFLMAGSQGGTEADASNAPVLRRRVSLDLNGVSVDDALKELSRQAGLELSYSPRVVALDQPVTLRARDITVAAALTEILLDVAVDVSVTTGGHLALIQRSRVPNPVPGDTGAVAGQVTDAQRGSPIVGATVTIDGTRATATTGADGRYRIGLGAGTYTVRARYIGYRPVSQNVTIGEGEEATADLALAKSAQELDQVVVTGTIVPTEVKAVPTPVTVITSSEIDRQRPHSVQELLRQAIPTGVSWDYPGVPYQTSISMRGATSFSAGSGQAKIFIDGVEVANQTDAALDAYSIERVEVVRGPQAAAVYGPGALGGVIQIFTKRGDPNQKRPEIDAEAGFGVVQTPYAGYGAVFRQDYRTSMRGTSGDVSYNVGAGYRHTGDYIPNGEISRQSNPSVYGGMRYAHGIVSLDLSGRYYNHDAPQVFNPDLIQSGFTFFAKPFYLPSQAQNQTVGAQLSIAPTRWWRHTLTAGIDRLDLDAAQTQPRLTTPADTLLEVVKFGYTKTSIGYNTSVQGNLLPSVSASFTAGFDYYRLPVSSLFTFGAFNTTGTIQLAPNQSFSVGRSITTNTGYFGQLQVGLRDALFLTAGLRADQNSDFGDSLGTPFSPRVGLSYVQQVSAARIKLRGSYGRAIRAPGFGFKLAASSPVGIVLANPSLAPERQRGWDAGVDAAFGSRVSLGLTYYDQTADNLIQYVLLQAGPPATYQYQNVGRVVNTGIEVEASLDLGPVLLKGQYGYARSRIAQLAASYSGDLAVGDQSRDTPKHTAGATLTARLFKGTTLTGGLTYVGSWNDYDYIAEFRCFGGTGPCRAALRDYVMAYPGFVKLNATLFQQLTRELSGFISVDNLTGNNAFELYNRNAVMGRISTVGFRFQR